MALKIFKKIKYELFETDDLLINWNNFDKGVLILSFGALSQFGAGKWYIYNFLYLEQTRWLNATFFQPRMISLTICFLIFVVLLFLCHFYKNNLIFRTFISYFSPAFFGIVMIYGGYTVGIYSAPTLSGFISIILVGLVFYERKVLYSIAIPITLYTLTVCYLSSKGLIAYAPLFTDELNQSQVFQNKFWIMSMVELFLPILLVSVFFFEILLSQWRRREQKIERLSTTDALTGAYNRRYINQQLEENGLQFYSIIILDLDYFKHINDSYGHSVGDDVLCRVAQILKSCLRQNDIVGRFGGEEFILILPEKDLSQALEIAERCKRAIAEELIILKDISVHVTASFGVASSNGEHLKDEMIRLADQALYLSKEKGRNQVSHYQELKN